MRAWIVLMTLVLTLCCVSNTHGQAPSPNPELAKVLQDLSAAAAAQHYTLIKEAIDASPLLMRQMNQLSQDHLLTEIVVAPESSPFDGRIERTKIILSTRLLSALSEARLYDAEANIGAIVKKLTVSTLTDIE